MSNAPSSISDRGGGARPGMRRRVVWGGCVLVLALLIWSGCGTPKERYDFMTFWFDGVPHPDEMVGRGRRGPAMIVSAHKPFIEGKCEECHSGGKRSGMRFFGFAQLDETICMQCHEEVASAHLRMHGPVAAAACKQCHVSHESRFPHLLRDQPLNLCRGCHDVQTMRLRPVREHDEEKRNCLDCHSGHGGPERFFLHPDPETDKEEDGGASDERGDSDMRVLSDEDSGPGKEGG